MDTLEAVLVLEDGSLFFGRPFGAVDVIRDQDRQGEVVFATAMTGYQEICTDPSYHGQMVVLTYPLIGNYGISAEVSESHQPWLAALIVREYTDEYSHWQARESLNAYLHRHGIPGLAEVDTRALTRRLRASGTQRGILRAYPIGQRPRLEALREAARAVPPIAELDLVAEVSTPEPFHWPSFVLPSLPADDPDRRPRIVIMDTGCKQNIPRCLAEYGAEVILMPHVARLGDITALSPQGVLLANGPGDPSALSRLIDLTSGLLHLNLPLMGICLGHQLIALAAGGRTSRLPFGHHGSNHPVKDLRTGRVTITAQNHNFQVEAASLPADSGLKVSHVNLSDGSVEGLYHESKPIFSVQFHPEAAPGPHDNRYLLAEFVKICQLANSLSLSGIGY
jgi:carbamoyl-phosphate synthase small subunit